MLQRIFAAALAVAFGCSNVGAVPQGVTPPLPCLAAAGLCALQGSVLFSGTAPLFTASGQVAVVGKTTQPTFNGSYTTLAIGSSWSGAPTFNLNGQAAIFSSAAYGLILSGQGATGDIGLADHTGVIRAYLKSNGYLFATAGLQFNGLFAVSSGTTVATATSPTIASGATIGTVGGGSFGATFTATAASTATVVTMGATALHAWNCYANDQTTPSTVVVQTGFATTGPTFTPYSRTTGVALSTWGNADTVSFTCFAY